MDEQGAVIRVNDTEVRRWRVRNNNEPRNRLRFSTLNPGSIHPIVLTMRRAMNTTAIHTQAHSYLAFLIPSPWISQAEPNLRAVPPLASAAAPLKDDTPLTK